MNPYRYQNSNDEDFDSNGVTGLFGRNLRKEDLAIAKAFLDEHGVDVLNARVFKNEKDSKYIVRVKSISKELSQDNIVFMGKVFDLRYGEFAPYLEECVKYIKQALKYCQSDL